MITAVEKEFPNGIPAFMSATQFGRIVGMSPPQVLKVMKERPDMVVRLPAMKDKRIRSDLYFELIGKKEEE